MCLVLTSLLLKEHNCEFVFLYFICIIPFCILFVYFYLCIRIKSFEPGYDPPWSWQDTFSTNSRLPVQLGSYKLYNSCKISDSPFSFYQKVKNSSILKFANIFMTTTTWKINYICPRKSLLRKWGDLGAKKWHKFLGLKVSSDRFL